MDWMPSVGYDAKDGTETFQIKSRRDSSGGTVNRAGRMGLFGHGKEKMDYEFDHGLLAELDDSFELTAIWQLDRSEIERLERGEEPPRGLHVGAFVKAAKERKSVR